MAKILLNYFMPISVIPTIPEASTAFLKNACVIAKPKSGQEANVGKIFECVSMSEVSVLTDNTNAQQLFNAGMSKAYVLLADHLDLATTLDTDELAGDFYTLLISDDFVDEDIDTEAATLTKAGLTFTAKATGGGGNEISIELLDSGVAGAETVTVTDKKISVSMKGGESTATQIKTAIDAKPEAAALITVAIVSGQAEVAQAAFAEDFLEGGSGQNFGTFEGVVAYSSDDAEICADFATAENRCAFFTNSTNKAKNMFYAFGKLLSNQVNWSNQQYISMPFNDDVDVLGEAISLFDDKVSFVINDDEFGNRLALFCAGGKAIVAPYISKNLRIDLQSRGLSWVAANQPSYTLTNAALLEARLQEDIIQQRYIDTGWIDAGVVSIKLLNDNFVGTAEINIAEPRALWRIEAEMRSTL